MLTYLAVFSVFSICGGLLIAKVYEWRQDVLYGPYIGREGDEGK